MDKILQTLETIEINLESCISELKLQVQESNKKEYVFDKNLENSTNDIYIQSKKTKSKITEPKEEIELTLKIITKTSTSTKRQKKTQSIST